MSVRFALVTARVVRHRHLSISASHAATSSVPSSVYIQDALFPLPSCARASASCPRLSPIVVRGYMTLSPSTTNQHIGSSSTLPLRPGLRTKAVQEHRQCGARASISSASGSLLRYRRTPHRRVAGESPPQRLSTSPWPKSGARKRKRIRLNAFAATLALVAVLAVVGYHTVVPLRHLVMAMERCSLVGVSGRTFVSLISVSPSMSVFSLGWAEGKGGTRDQRLTLTILIAVGSRKMHRRLQVALLKDVARDRTRSSAETRGVQEVSQALRREDTSSSQGQWRDLHQSTVDSRSLAAHRSLGPWNTESRWLARTTFGFSPVGASRMEFDDAAASGKRIAILCIPRLNYSFFLSLSLTSPRVLAGSMRPDLDRGRLCPLPLRRRPVYLGALLLVRPHPHRRRLSCASPHRHRPSLGPTSGCQDHAPRFGRFRSRRHEDDSHDA
jgi:hypothetical protein